MPKRKPGTLLRRELRVLGYLASIGPAHGLIIADMLEMPSRTVYSALVRLEGMDLVTSAWATPTAPRERPRRVYTLTAKGRRAAR